MFLNLELLVAMLVFAAFALAVAHINHSRDTENYRILKFGLYVLFINQIFNIFRVMALSGTSFGGPALYIIFVGYYATQATAMVLIAMYMLLLFPDMAGRQQLLYKIFFISESAAVVLIMTTVFTGVVYTEADGVVVPGIAVPCIAFLWMAVLSAFLVAVVMHRQRIERKLFQNWAAILAAGIALQAPCLFRGGADLFGFFAGLFFLAATLMFHCGVYEEGNARMGRENYHSELGYYLGKKRQFFVYEIKITNYDRLVERRRLSEEELDGLHGMLMQKLSAKYPHVMLFHKRAMTLSAIAAGMETSGAKELAYEMRDWMGAFFSGCLEFCIAVVKCPDYAGTDQEVGHLLGFLLKKCPVRECYFCGDGDADEFREREEILRLLHDMRLEKSDVVLFGRPVVESGSAQVRGFEILCRLQMAGSGILASDHVIKLARQYGYIHDVNMAVLEKTCEFLSSNLEFASRYRVSIHISNEELESTGFADDVAGIVGNYDLMPGNICFEVTMLPGESDVERMEEAMEALRWHDISFTLTDFDPSFVNFESLMRLPFETVKFERHCIYRAAKNAKDYDVEGMLVDMFREHGFNVAFKGIDNAELADVAMSLGADYLQGEKYAKPFPLEEIDEQSL